MTFAFNACLATCAAETPAAVVWRQIDRFTSTLQSRFVRRAIGRSIVSAIQSGHYAILPGAVLIDRSFLPDPAMLALTTLGLWLFVRFLRRGGTGLLLLSTAALTLGILAKLPGIAVGAVFAALAVATLAPARVTELPKVLAAGCAALAAVLGYYAWAVHLGSSYPPYHVAGHGYLWDVGLGAFIRDGFHLGAAYDHFVHWYLGWPLLILALIGLLHPPPYGPGGARSPLRWTFHIWLAAGICVFLVAAKEVVTNPWNFHVLSAPIAAFAGRGLHIVAIAGHRRSITTLTPLRVTAAALFCLVAGTSPGLDLMKRPYAESGLRLGRTLDALAGPEDLVVAVSATVGDPVAVYYSRRRGWVFPPGGGQRDWSRLTDHEEALAELSTLISEGASWFGIPRNARDSAGRYFVDHHSALLEWLDARAEQVVNDGDIIIYRIGPR